MLFTRVFLILSAYSIAFSATEQVCFSNQKEYAAVQTKLPVVLQQLPTQLVTDNFLVKAAASLKPDPSSIVFFFNASKGIEEPIEEKVKVCTTPEQIVLHFENGVKELIEIRNEKEINVRRMINMQYAATPKFTNISNAITNSKEKSSRSTIESNTTGSRGNL